MMPGLGADFATRPLSAILLAIAGYGGHLETSDGREEGEEMCYADPANETPTSGSRLIFSAEIVRLSRCGRNYIAVQRF